jgi:tetratricopeptide (TPR) repeat protein
MKQLQKAVIVSSLFINMSFAASESEYLCNATNHKKQGNSDSAIIDYQRALSINPRSFEAHFNLAHEFFFRSQFDDAITHYQQALRVQPGCHQAHYNLGVAWSKISKFEPAAEHFKKAVSYDPNYIKAYFQLGKMLENLKRAPDAIDVYKALLMRDNSHFDCLLSISDLLRAQDQTENALEYLEKACTLRPNDMNCAFQLGCAYVFLGKINDAIASFEKVLAIAPNNPQALYNIAYSLKMDWQLDKAITMYKKVLEVCPNYEPAIFALGMAYLQNGEFDAGWKQHEIDLKKEHKNSDLLREYLRTNSVNGKTLLLRPEGGLGDTIMFIRYAHKLKEMGARILALVQKPLVPLLSNCPFIDEIIPTGTTSLPFCHEAATFMTLPALFNSNEQTIPQNIPYIFPDKALVEKWKTKLSADKQFKVGICWQADVFNDSSRPKVARRGMHLKTMYELGDVQNVSLYSLQQFDGVEQLKSIPPTFKIHVFDADFDKNHGSFMDTAAVMQELDLIISVDTAIAHLAGALGKKVWLLLPFATDWRWLVNRTDTPWYPSMKIFKQSTPFDWASVMRQVKNELEQLVKQ